MLNLEKLHANFNPRSGELTGAPVTRRHLRDLKGCFADRQAFEQAALTNPLLYQVSSFAPGIGPGDLHCGLGVLMPGKVGAEYYMTKGHLHQRREAAEYYIGLSGEGVMLLEEEAGGQSRMIPLQAEQLIYVPGHTAHRTINTGQLPLTYLGIHAADAGHDYSTIEKLNFRCVVVEHQGQPTMLDRKTFLSR